MNSTRWSNHALTPGVIVVLLFSLVLSFAFAGTAAAAPRSCVFTATSSASILGITGDISGSLTEIYAGVTKYTDGCGSEYGSIAADGTSNFYSATATVSVGSASNSRSLYFPGALTTPIIVGNGPVCGVITWIGFGPDSGSGQASNCTPS